MDTLEGVSEWWLLDARAPHPMKEIQSAIDELKKAGLVEEIGRPGRIHYRLRRKAF